MIRMPPSPRRRRPSLTPMIDVVFLLMVFFMLVARFGGEDGLALMLGSADRAAPYSGPPRLVTVLPEGITLNGVPVTDLPAALAPLMTSAQDVVIVRPAPGTGVDRLLSVLAGLEKAGLTRLAVVE